MTQPDNHDTDPRPLPASSFFRQSGTSSFTPTAGTGSPWGPQTQHLGPCAGLLARAVEQHIQRGGRKRLARITFDTFAPIPLQEINIHLRSVKPGRRAELVEAVAEVDSQTVLAARAWCLSPVPGDYQAQSSVPPLLAPQLRPQHPHLPGAYLDGYISAINWHFTTGGFDVAGPAQVWTRPRIPLLPNEKLSPWQRALVVADSAYGAAGWAAQPRYPVINVDLTVALYRAPRVEWIGLDSRTAAAANEGAVNTTTIHDLTGPAGTAIQTLLAQPS